MTCLKRQLKSLRKTSISPLMELGLAEQECKGKPLK